MDPCRKFSSVSGCLSAPFVIVFALMVSGFATGQEPPVVLGNAIGNGDVGALIGAISERHFSQNQSASDRESARSNVIQKFAAALIKQFDSDNDQMLSSDEMSKMRRPLAKADGNGDGFATVEELTAALEASSSSERSSSSAAAGTARRFESPAARQESAPTRSGSTQVTDDRVDRFRDYAVQVIRQYDTNGDGLLDKDEASRMRRQPSNADENGDGLISADELLLTLTSSLNQTSASRSGSMSSEGTPAKALPAESIGLAVLAVHVPDGADLSVPDLADSMRTADLGRLQSLALRMKNADRLVVFASAESPLNNTVELSSTCQTRAGAGNGGTSNFEIQLMPRRVGDQMQVGFTIRQSEEQSRGLGLSAAALPRPDSNAIWQVSEANGIWIIAVCARPVDSAAPTSRSRTSGRRDSQPRALDLPQAPDRERSNDRESDRSPQRPRRGGGGE